jgi:hypothetical protein
MSKRGEDMTRLDVIVLALCIGGRSFAWGAKVREIMGGTVKIDSVTPETYASVMSQLARAEADALVECARAIEQQLERGSA